MKLILISSFFQFEVLNWVHFLFSYFSSDLGLRSRFRFMDLGFQLQRWWWLFTDDDPRRWCDGVVDPHGLLKVKVWGVCISFLVGLWGLINWSSIPLFMADITLIAADIHWKCHCNQDFEQLCRAYLGWCPYYSIIWRECVSLQFKTECVVAV